MIEGRPFTIVTDHRPLCHLFTTKKPIKIERCSRWAEFISQYSTNIVHVTGASNIVADALSRPEVNSLSTAPLSTQNATAQSVDEEIKKIGAEGFRQHILKEVFVNNQTGLSILCSEFQGHLRPILPQKMRREIFLKLHDIDHSGKKATLRKIGSRYFWPGMNKDVKNWVKACHKCQLVKTSHHTISPLQSFPPSDRFQHVHIDIVVLELSRGYRYLLTMIDRATRWIEAVPIKDMEAKTVAAAFLENWISRYGVPLKLTSDRGRQFQSTLFSELCNLLGTEQITTTAYNPKGNGMIERVHRRLKEALKALGDRDWLAGLPMILLGLRAAPREESGVSCAEMTFGRTLILPGEFCDAQSSEIDDTSQYVQQLRQSIRKISPMATKWKSNRKVFVPQDLHTTDQVYVRVDRVRSPLEPPYEGPYKVIKRRKKYFIIEKNGKNEVISIDRLKPAYQLSTDTDNHKEDSEGHQSIIKFKKKPEFYSLIDLPTPEANLPSSPSTVVPSTSYVDPPALDPPIPALPPPPKTPSSSRSKKVTFGDHSKVTSSGRQVRKPARFTNF